MNLVALDLPDNIIEWPNWLEQHLVGLQLRDLVRQLELIQDKPSETLKLESLIADSKTQLLEIGLISLSESQLIALVQNPRALFELQEMVLVEGGSYWQTIATSDEHLALTSQLGNALSEAISRESRNEATKPERPESSSLNSMAPAESPRIHVANREVLTQVNNDKNYPASISRRSWLAMACTIAALLLFAFLPSLLQKKDQGNFFAKQGLLTSDLRGSDFLLAISSSIQADWNTKTSSSTELATQLQKFRDSCDTLINAKLTQLNPAAANELRKRCGVWKEKISNSLAQLSAGASASEVQIESNATIEKLAQFLSELSRTS